MSQQKDSNQGEHPGDPIGTPAGPTLEPNSPAGSAPADAPVDAAAGDPTVALGKAAAADIADDGDSGASTAAADAPADAADADADSAAVADRATPDADAVPLGESGDAAGAGAARGKGSAKSETASAAKESGASAANSAAAEASTPRRVVTLASIALLAVAAVAAAWFGGTWIVGGLLRDKPRGDARDAALAAAQQAAINITSMNLNDIDGSLALARSSMTGDLLDASTKNEAQIKKTAADSNVNTTSKVVGGAITELNSERDQAGALVVLEVTESGAGKPTGRLRYTWSVDVVLKDGVWKADQVEAVADPVSVGGSAPAQQAPADPTTPPAPQPGN
ncbi:hypothetical protein [Nocardia sp. NPDC056100]|uniref:hypothetical protein n=1 Tax=Nocardia sp. NPDC056100 TaxID=3345712 RepID=UPI0035DAF179